MVIVANPVHRGIHLRTVQRGGIGSCYINVSAGNYIKAANSSTQSTCTAGYWNPAHTVYYGNTSSCNKCTGTTYSDTDGASSCKADAQPQQSMPT